MSKNLRTRLKDENISINEFIRELDINIEPIEKIGLLPDENMQGLKNLRNEINSNDKLTDKEIDRTMGQLVGYRKNVSFVDRAISVIKTLKNKVLDENDVIAQADMSKTFNELARKGFAREKMQETADMLLENARLDGTDSVLETIPTDKNNIPEVQQIIDYGEKHPGVRREGKNTIIKLLQEAGKKQGESTLARVSYKQLDSGRGLSESEIKSFKGSAKHNEPDSPSIGSALKSWVEGYKKELQEQKKQQLGKS